MKMDELLYGIAEKVANFAAIYLCDLDEVPDFNEVSSITNSNCSRFTNNEIRCTNYTIR